MYRFIYLNGQCMAVLDAVCNRTCILVIKWLFDKHINTTLVNLPCPRT